MRTGRLILLTLTLAAPLALAACAANPGAFTWVDQYKPNPQAGEQEYVLAAGDLIAVRVYNQEGVSARLRVRSDGRITLPFLGDVMAGGVTPAALSTALQGRLKEFVVNPVVTVTLEEARPSDVYVVGEVARPGRYPIEGKAGVLQALASAGGLTGFARRDQVYVIRNDPAPVRIRFSVDALTHLEGKAAAFRLRAGDTIVVE